jgi:hypothetical protein
MTDKFQWTEVRSPNTPWIYGIFHITPLNTGISFPISENSMYVTRNDIFYIEHMKTVEVN